MTTTAQVTVTDTFDHAHGIQVGDTLRQALAKLRQVASELEPGSYCGLGTQFGLSDKTLVEVGHVAAEGGGCLLGQYEAVRRAYTDRGQIVGRYSL